jgi:rhodanese-related sulfurtransferase
LIALGVLLGLSINTLRPNGLPLDKSWTPPKLTGQDIDGIQEVSLDEAWALYEAGQAVFLDARDPVAFREGHIAGALNVPPEEVDLYTEEIRVYADSGMEIISYCDGIDCPLSPEVALALKERGISEVRILVNGWSAWRRAGYPVKEEMG